MKKLVLKYGLYLAGTLFLLTFLVDFKASHSKPFAEETAQFNKKLLEKERELKAYLAKQRALYHRKGLAALKQDDQSGQFQKHLYCHDSLVWWNTNQFPVSPFANIHYPAAGILKFQNGWYYAAAYHDDSVYIAVSFPIRFEYTYVNEYLKREFAPDFQLSFPAQLVFDHTEGYPIRDENGRFLFSIVPKNNQVLTDGRATIMLVLLMLSLASFLFGLVKQLRRTNRFFPWIIYLTAVTVHVFMVFNSGYDFLDRTRFLDPSLYANSEWFPDLLTCILNVTLIFAGVQLLSEHLKRNPMSGKRLLILLPVLLFVLTYLLIGLTGYVSQSLVMDSSIPLELEKLFRLNVYSFWAVWCIGMLTFSCYILLRTLLTNLFRIVPKPWLWVMVFGVSGVIYALINHRIGQDSLILNLWPLVLSALVMYQVLKLKNKLSFNSVLLQLMVISLFVGMSLAEFNRLKEQDELALFASQLASDQDVSTELEFESLARKLTADAYFQKLMLNGRRIGPSEIREYLERRYLNGFWDRYACDFYLFDDANKALINMDTRENSSAYLEQLLRRHSIPSEIDSRLFYIKDYTSQLSYICKLDLFGKYRAGHLQLFVTFKSKRIPEKIGLPRLLISESTQVFKPLENYAIAKYYSGKLVSRNGKFSYPLEASALYSGPETEITRFEAEGYNHYMYRKNNQDLIVLSRRQPTGFELLSAFSYLFCFYGILLLVPLAMIYLGKVEFSNWSFAFKIQLTLISLMLFALIVFGLSSGQFIKNQYNAYSHELIRDKIGSVDLQIRQYLELNQTDSTDNRSAIISLPLSKIAAVFVADINLYGPEGYLLGTSRPKLFNSGLQSEQMHPVALEQIRQQKRSDYLQTERIGKLEYLSAYKPLLDQDGQLIAYINLQYFGQQRGVEQQIENFLIAVINIFMLLLASSVVLAVYVSNWVTAPLRRLRQNLAGIRLGKYNKPLDYRADDEIGALVRNYNRKLEELAYTAGQLAISERESAWREMAKQVAHEIKNPLTPMKLSLQHLQRVYDPTDPDAREKLNQVIHSLIVQIDALTSIANEFSNFAKMPVENREPLDLLPLIRSAVMVLAQEFTGTFEWEIEEASYMVNADRELMLRVCNNLLKNAIQAVPEDREGKIRIAMRRQADHIEVSITDNGRGIPEEIRPKIFTPNFTTKSTGTGLGLAMVKQIIEVHGGKIAYETIPDEQTTFTFELPLMSEA